MTTATAQDRLRQIAILVSSVDASAARQILLHLPTDKAKRVRELASQLGTVSPQEKRKILAEFQRSAAASTASQSNVNHDSSAVAGSARRMATGQTHDRFAAAVDELAAQTGGSPGHTQATPGPYQPLADNSSGQLYGTDVDAQMGWKKSDTTSPHQMSNSWTQLSPAALIRFVRHERPAVTAVVISQLAPHVAVEVLQHLPAETDHEVLVRLSRLGDIDPEAMQAIDEHLSQRLGEYQHKLASELENSRRMQLLLAAAPADLRQQWSSILAAQSDQPAVTTPNVRQQQPNQPVDKAADLSLPGVGQPPEDAWNSQATETQDVLDISSSVFTTADTVAPLSSAQAIEDRHLVGYEQTNAASANDGQYGQANVLPFPQKASSDNATDAIDQSLIQIEFEQILHLPPWMLANLLSQTDSQFVLLALAGATPQFMKRFMDMLDRQDAKALQSRLQRIGPIRLRDVDDAQRRIVENAIRMTKHEQLRRAA